MRVQIETRLIMDNVLRRCVGGSINVIKAMHVEIQLNDDMFKNGKQGWDNNDIGFHINEEEEVW